MPDNLKTWYTYVSLLVATAWVAYGFAVRKWPRPGLPALMPSWMRLLALSVFCIGGWCNVIAIALNDGKMPVRTSNIIPPEDRPRFSDDIHSQETAQTRVRWLTDIFGATLRLPFGSYHLRYSIGDILVFTGLFLVIVSAVMQEYRH